MTLKTFTFLVILTVSIAIVFSMFFTSYLFIILSFLPQPTAQFTPDQKVLHGC